MRRYVVLAMLALALVLLANACGGSGSGQDMQSMDHGGGSQGRQAEEKTDERMAGMDHSNMGHGSMSSDDMARQMVMEDGKYSDDAFIDAMVPHHQGAVEMAEVALRNAEHEEIVQLSENIISSQQAEIEELKSIKEQEFGTSQVPTDMSQEEMQMMGMTDPQELANREPFDKAFIDAMIPHHQSAIAMAGVALDESENPRIREIAQNIVSAQEREIAQMDRWRNDWYPEG